MLFISRDRRESGLSARLNSGNSSSPSLSHVASQSIAVCRRTPACLQPIGSKHDRRLCSYVLFVRRKLHHRTVEISKTRSGSGKPVANNFVYTDSPPVIRSRGGGGIVARSNEARQFLSGSVARWYLGGFTICPNGEQRKLLILRPPQGSQMQPGRQWEDFLPKEFHFLFFDHLLFLPFSCIISG